MKRNQIIEITIRADGDISIDAVGFTGSDCNAATAFLEDALGQIDQRTRKRESYRSQTTKNINQIGNHES